MSQISAIRAVTTPPTMPNPTTTTPSTMERPSSPSTPPSRSSSLSTATGRGPAIIAALDSPTIPERVAVNHVSAPHQSTATMSSSPTPINITATKSQQQQYPHLDQHQGLQSQHLTLRKPAPSPLHASIAVSPPSSASPTRSNFPSPIHDLAAAGQHHQQFLGQPFRDPTSSYSTVTGAHGLPSPASPISPLTSCPSQRFQTFPPNESTTRADPVVTEKRSGGTSVPNLSTMASNANARVEAVQSQSKGAPRNSSIDSAISAMSSKAHSHHGSTDSNAGPNDIANLVKAAGSHEGAIQYLLKDKQSQAQQNSQLWRLVDKQRAMILGLNKDLERSLKEKEKYRKKLKEVLAAHEATTSTDNANGNGNTTGAAGFPRVELDEAKDPIIPDGPASPFLPEQDSTKPSPVDMSMAPYPITPPADQMANGGGSPTKIGQLLNPSHNMPKSSEHALDQYDHEAEDRAREEARKAAQPPPSPRDFGFNASLPPSQPLPDPPRGPPSTKSPTSPTFPSAIEQYGPPSAPPPRKPPPAPLQLKRQSTLQTFLAPDDGEDSESDYDDLLAVSNIPNTKERGRRRTREEDDRVRELLAQQEAEARSASKKSNSQAGTPLASENEPPIPNSNTMPTLPAPASDNQPLSLAGVLSGDEPRQTAHALAPPLMSPGLPSSPRPMPGGTQSVHSPPLSPRAMVGGGQGLPLSPRAPRQPIPLPPNTPLYTPSPAAAVEPLDLKSPKPLNLTKSVTAPDVPASPSAHAHSDSVDRTTIFKGFATEEFPDLLLPPNALPSIAVRVASSRLKPSRASMLSLTQFEEDPVFTLAIHSRSTGGELWRVEKDTASLSKLDQRMKQCPAFTAKTPDRSLFSGHSPAKLDARRVVLNEYLEELVNTELDPTTAIEFCKYLSTNALRPNSDETGPTADQEDESSGLKTGPGGRPLKSGYLTKRGKSFGGWKARFFVLDGPILKYYETPGGAHMGNIKLQSAQIGKQSSQNGDSSSNNNASGGGDELDKQYRHAFLVMEPKKKDSTTYVKHVLCAESDRERDQWVDVLMKWIDYKDPSDDEQPRHIKKKGPPQRPHTSHGSGGGSAMGNGDGLGGGDELIGMSYGSAKQGDIPEGVPSVRRRGTNSPEFVEKPAYTISGPKNAQPITDASMWGGKMTTTLAPPGPTMEEKKQRKRSFFGFGPKVRSGSDDQDSLYGSSGGNAAQQSNESRGPIRQAFGAPLAEAVRFNSPVDVNVPVPAVVYRCIQYLDSKDAIYEEGIFRLSGSNVVIKGLKERFNTEGDVNLITDETYYDIHAVASLLKLYLRELPTTILTAPLHNQFVTVTEMTNQREKLQALSELVLRLPQANATLIKYLVAFLINIINHADRNKMTVRNVGIVFSPTLNIPAPVFALLLQNYEPIFGINPEDYELPVPIDETTYIQQQPRRPSTATNDSSPPSHMRSQRLPSASNLSSTPPPMLTQRPSTATPPPTQHQVYEPSYLSQQYSSSSNNLSSRPAYENSNTVSANFDAGISYQQPPYQSGGSAAYDQGPMEGAYEYHQHQRESANSGSNNFNARAKRRESSMFMMNGGGMGGLSNQGSKSRLREETRM